VGTWWTFKKNLRARGHTPHETEMGREGRWAGEEEMAGKKKEKMCATKMLPGLLSQGKRLKSMPLSREKKKNHRIKKAWTRGARGVKGGEGGGKTDGKA